MSLLQLPLREIHKRMTEGSLSALDLTEASLDRIKEVDPQVRAFITVDEERALSQAKDLDDQLAGKTVSYGPLAGLPVGIKDNISTEGVRTTAGSKHLSNYYPIYDATVIERLRNAQTIPVGKLNMDELAMGSSSENSFFHPTYNPWDLSRVPGGSSGGSAAAVAAGEVYFSLGTDTGGSIRQPASFCGVVGLKPTYGRVSRYGLIAFASSLDQIGPLTKNVEDAAYVLQAIAGYDPMDSTTSENEVPDYLAALSKDIKGLRIAVPKEMMGEGIQTGVRKQIEEAIKLLEGLGAICEEVTLPHLEYAVATYYVISSAEASSNLARLDGIRYGMRVDGKDLIDMYKRTRGEGMGKEVKRRTLFGTLALSSGFYDKFYRKAQQVRTLIRQDYEQLFQQYDVIVGPTSPVTAFRIGERIEDPLTMYLNDICTLPVNLAGLPAVSVPCGLADGLPVGLQIIGRAFDEATVLQVAHAYEQQAKPLPEPSLEVRRDEV